MVDECGSHDENNFVEPATDCDPAEIGSGAGFNANNPNEVRQLPTDDRGNYVTPDGEKISPDQVDLLDWANQGKDSGLDDNNLANLLGLLGLLGCGGVQFPSFSLPTISLPDLDINIPDIDFDIDFDLDFPDLCQFLGNGVGVVGLIRQAYGLVASRSGGCKKAPVKKVEQPQHIETKEDGEGEPTKGEPSFEEKQQGNGASIFDIVDIGLNVVNDLLNFVQSSIAAVMGAINSVTGQITSAVNSVVGQLAPLSASAAALDAAFGGAAGTGGISTQSANLGVTLGNISVNVSDFAQNSQNKIAAAPSSTFTNKDSATAYVDVLTQEQQVMAEYNQQLEDMNRAITNMAAELSQNLIESGITPDNPLYQRLMANFEATLKNANRTAEEINFGITQSNKRIDDATDAYISFSV